MKARYCTECGGKNVITARFCGSCGEALTVEARKTKTVSRSQKVEIDEDDYYDEEGIPDIDSLKDSLMIGKSSDKEELKRRYDSVREARLKSGYGEKIGHIAFTEDGSSRVKRHVKMTKAKEAKMVKEIQAWAGKGGRGKSKNVGGE